MSELKSRLLRVLNGEGSNEAKVDDILVELAFKKEEWFEKGVTSEVTETARLLLEFMDRRKRNIQKVY